MPSSTVNTHIYKSLKNEGNVTKRAACTWININRLLPFEFHIIFIIMKSKVQRGHVTHFALCHGLEQACRFMWIKKKKTNDFVHFVALTNGWIYSRIYWYQLGYLARCVFKFCWRIIKKTKWLNSKLEIWRSSSLSSWHFYITAVSHCLRKSCQEKRQFVRKMRPRDVHHAPI